LIQPRSVREGEGHAPSPPAVGPKGFMGSISRSSSRPRPRTLARIVASFLSCVALSAPGALAHAGVTGKISGRVLDAKKQPLASANVVIPAARVGAATDADGYFTLLDLPPGAYDVKVSLLGYRSVTTQGVEVTSDHTTRLDVELQEEAVEMQEVVVQAKRPVVETNLTSTRYVLSKEEIGALPVQELQEVVNLQAGVVDGHFRGGRLGEVQYQINGITVNDPYDNKSGIRIDRSLLQEVQVISGNFDAEYGQAMSGVVNAVLKSGGDRLEWNAELLGGDYLYRGIPRRPIEYERHFGSVQNYQLSLSGPTGLPKTTFLLSGRRYLFDDFNWGQRLVNPADFNHEIITGDGKEMPLGYTREWSGLGKVTNRSLANMDFGYEAVWSDVQGRKATNAYRFNPDGLSKQQTFSITHGLDFKHRLTPKTYYSLSLRQNYKNYRDRAYSDLFDPRYDDAGPPVTFAGDPFGFVIGGVEFTRFLQRTNAFVYKAQFTSQVRRDHLLKLGWESQLPTLTFGNDGWLTFTQEQDTTILRRRVDEPPDYPGPKVFKPVQWAAYAQDEMEWSDVTLRAGLRLDYFQSRAFVPSDPANPANAIAGAPLSVQQPTSRKLSFAPRLGISHPVGKDAAVFFAYGHFYQMPGLGDLFGNADYRVLANLQAGTQRFGVLGNPDVGPQRTVAYEFGYKQAVRENLGVDLTLFYKDIRDLLGVEFISTYSAAEYPRFTNVDFGSVVGFTLAVDQRPIGPFSAALDYTWQSALGNSSDARETATRAENGQDPRPRQVPFDWDQRHTLNLTLTLADPKSYVTSAVVRVVSGQPYTPEASGILSTGPEENSGRKPGAVVVDFRGERRLQWAGLKGSAFGRVFNAFDTRFFNGSVFADTGSPYYSRSPNAVLGQLADPNRLYAPRRIEVGLTLGNS
jgi:hypothetical protein